MDDELGQILLTGDPSRPPRSTWRGAEGVGSQPLERSPPTT